MGHGGRLAPLRRAALRAFRNWRLAARRTDHELLTEPTFIPSGLTSAVHHRATSRAIILPEKSRPPPRRTPPPADPGGHATPVPSRHVGKQENGLDLVSV